MRKQTTRTGINVNWSPNFVQEVDKVENGWKDKMSDLPAVEDWKPDMTKFENQEENQK